MPKLSILVAVYNVRPYLTAFVDSLVQQRLHDAEVIFVEDCSTDGTRELLLELCAPDSALSMSSLRVRVITLEQNGGVSMARQTALDAAEGEYVIFADPDDWIDSGMYEELVGKADQDRCDVVWEDFFENGERRSGKLAGVPNGEDLIVAILAGKLHGSTWNKLLRREFVVSSGAHFLTGRVGLCEDVDFLCQVLMRNPRCAYHDGCHYHYRHVSDSATHGTSSKKCYSLMRVEEHLTRILQTTKTMRALLLWKFGWRSSSRTGLVGGVLHVTYRIMRWFLV